MSDTKKNKDKMTPEEYFISITIMIMLAMCFINVFLRYIFNTTILIFDSILNNLFPWITFVGAAVSCYQEKNVAFTLLTDSFPKPIQKYVEVFVLICHLAFFGFLFYYGTIKSINYYTYNATIPAMKGAPRWIFSLCVPVGSFLCIIRSLQVFIKRVKGLKENDNLIELE